MGDLNWVTGPWANLMIKGLGGSFLAKICLEKLLWPADRRLHLLGIILSGSGEGPLSSCLEGKWVDQVTKENSIATAGGVYDS